MNIWLERLKTFMDTPEEWHAFIEGFCDAFMPFAKGYEPSKELKTAIQDEHHYYNGGRIIGIIALIWFWIGVYKAVT